MYTSDPFNRIAIFINPTDTVADNVYQIIEAESHEQAAQMAKDNPHFVISTSYIDVMEVPRNMEMY